MMDTVYKVLIGLMFLTFVYIAVDSLRQAAKARRAEKAEKEFREMMEKKKKMEETMAKIRSTPPKPTWNHSPSRSSSPRTPRTPLPHASHSSVASRYAQPSRSRYDSTYEESSTLSDLMVLSSVVSSIGDSTPSQSTFSDTSISCVSDSSTDSGWSCTDSSPSFTSGD